MSAGTTLNITLITCLAAGSDFVGLPLVEALDNQLLGLPDVSTLMASNGAAWAQLWSGDIELVPKLLGDTAVDGMAQATRYALFRLYSAMRSGDNSNVFSTTVPSQINSVAGMMWVLPLLTLLQPPLAAAVLQYRYRALSRALNQASMYGWKGAMVSSNIRTAPLEGALLAVAAWDVYRVSQDMNALKTWIYPLLKGVADFIISRITSAVPAAVEGVVEMDPLQSKQVVPAGSAGSSLVNFVSKLALKATIEASYELSFVPKADWVGAYASLGILSYPNKVIKPSGSNDGSGANALLEALALLLPHLCGHTSTAVHRGGMLPLWMPTWSSTPPRSVCCLPTLMIHSTWLCWQPCMPSSPSGMEQQALLVDQRSQVLSAN